MLIFILSGWVEDGDKGDEKKMCNIHSWTTTTTTTIHMVISTISYIYKWEYNIVQVYDYNKLRMVIYLDAYTYIMLYKQVCYKYEQASMYIGNILYIGIIRYVIIHVY